MNELGDEKDEKKRKDEKREVKDWLNSTKRG